MSAAIIQFNGMVHNAIDQLQHSVDMHALWNTIYQYEKNLKKDQIKINYYKKILQQARGDHLGVKYGINAEDIQQAGWGIIFSSNADKAIIDALSPLINYRRQQINDTELFHIFVDGRGYRINENKRGFIINRDAGLGHGPVDPKKMPYYILLVGSPEEIPLSFQYELAIEHAVGRIHFDTLQEYSNYANNVVKYDKEYTNNLSKEKCLDFFATNHDKATELSYQYLVSPLIDDLKRLELPWSIQQCSGPDASKSALNERLGGDKTPNILLTASHGLEAHSKESLAQKKAIQGSLVCQKPNPMIATNSDYYYSAQDLKKNTDLKGLVHICFACYSAGTPDISQKFQFDQNKAQDKISDESFIASLPKKMLGENGALAFIGHIERAWSYSFYWSGIGGHTATFESLLHALMKGVPIGHAFEFFTRQYTELTVELNDLLEKIDYGLVHFSRERASGLWTMCNDARNYIILGDPYVRVV